MEKGKEEGHFTSGMIIQGEMVKKNNKKNIFFLISVLLIVIIIGGTVVLNQMKENESEEKNPVTDTENKEYVEYTNPDEYYNENGKILGKESAKKAKKVLSEKDVCALLAKRDFDSCLVTSSYSIDGEYYDSVEIENDSKTKHPMYEALFNSETEELWKLYVIADEIFAYPVSANLEREKETEIIVSETDELLSYDGYTNTYFRTKPDPAAVTIVLVDIIDADTLNKLTIEELN